MNKHALDRMLRCIPVNRNHPFPPPFADAIHPKKVESKKKMVIREGRPQRPPIGSVDSGSLFFDNITCACLSSNVVCIYGV